MDMIKIDLIEMRGDGNTDLITVALATSATSAFVFSPQKHPCFSGRVLSGATGVLGSS
jgi:hypothetical protein